MAIVPLMACAVSAAASAMVATAGAGSRHAAGWHLRALLRAGRGSCRRLGSSALVGTVLLAESWAHLSDEVVRWLHARGLHVGREEACAAALLATLVASACAGLLARSPVGAVAGALGLCVAVQVWHSSRVRARERALIDEMPQVFRTLAMALGSGETLTQAIEYVGMHERGFAGEAFVHAALRLRCGSSTEEAMAGLADELDAPGVALLTTALVIAQRTGSPLRGLFQSSAQLVERQGEYDRMLSVRTAQVRLSVRVVCLLPLILVCLLSLVSVDFQRGLTTPAGTACVLLAAVMDGCALLVIRRLMRGVL